MQHRTFLTRRNGKQIVHSKFEWDGNGVEVAARISAQNFRGAHRIFVLHYFSQFQKKLIGGSVAQKETTSSGYDANANMFITFALQSREEGTCRMQLVDFFLPFCDCVFKRSSVQPQIMHFFHSLQKEKSTEMVILSSNMESTSFWHFLKEKNCSCEKDLFIHAAANTRCHPCQTSSQKVIS